jgi:glyoxylase-like metal-dependent hydrolase (beta-lactamase superfamily II)
VDFVADSLPGADEFEVSVFGPGTGESIVLHLGGGAWAIVDSCRYPPTNDPAPLAYLEQIGVSTSQVEFVFASHWHDDHVQGLAETLEACPRAEFGCSGAYTGHQFEALTLEYPRSIKSAPIQEM